MTNPFLSPYTLPHGATPFHLISLSDYEEGVDKGIQEQNDEILRITQAEEAPTFQNTIEALDRSGETLDKVTTVLFNLLSAETDDQLDALSEHLSPLLSEHASQILHNKELFGRVKSVYEQYQSENLKERLTTEQQTLLQKTYDSFIRSGANLSDAEKERFTELTKELSLLQIKFSQNHLKDLNDYVLRVTDKKDLDGLPDHNLTVAREEAERRGEQGWTFTLHAPSYQPFLTYCANRELRRQMYMAYNTLCTHDNDHNNQTIVSDIVNKKRELAQLLGYHDYAAYVLTERMAETKENVVGLLDQLTNAYMPVAKEEVKEVECLAKELNGSDFRMMPWDFAYYSNKLKERKFNINSEMLRPYLQLEKVKDGVFGLATELYDIHFNRREDIPAYHDDVEVYEVSDSDGRYLALLYCDFFPRPSKKSGAWMTSYKEQWKTADGTDSRPHVSVTTNFTKPTNEKPSLLTLGELETFLHEFGHALHGIFSDTTYKSLNGTNVYWDFVELPSQFMENYAIEPSFLHKFAFHYQTGEALPEELIQRIVESRNFNVAYGCMRQVSFGKLDMGYYTLDCPFETDLMEFEKSIFDQNRLLSYVEGVCMSTQFSHIMAGGYSAGYYSYKWAEVLDADAFSLFKETGIYNKDTATRFRQQILSKGGTEHPMTLYRRFRGKSPSIDALLERNGIHPISQSQSTDHSNYSQQKS